MVSREVLGAKSFEVTGLESFSVVGKYFLHTHGTLALLYAVPRGR